MWSSFILMSDFILLLDWNDNLVVIFKDKLLAVVVPFVSVDLEVKNTVTFHDTVIYKSKNLTSIFAMLASLT